MTGYAPGTVADRLGIANPGIPEAINCPWCQRLAARPREGTKKAQVVIDDQAGDLGLPMEPPDGIEPSTYALRVGSGLLVHRLVLMPGAAFGSAIVRSCSPVWLLAWLLGGPVAPQSGGEIGPRGSADFARGRDNRRMTESDVELLPGERLLWEGRPLRHRLFRAPDALLIPFSLLWFGFVVFWEASVLTERTVGDRPPVFFVLWGVPFVLVGLYLVVGRFVVRAVASRRTRYVLTDLRILVIGGMSGNRTTSAYLRSLPPPVVAEQPDRSGNLAFGAFPGILDPFTHRNGLRGWASEPSSDPALWHIPEVRRVRDLIAGVQTERDRPTFHGHQG